MAISADDLTLRKLGITKRIYLEGTKQPSELSPIARLMAVIAYDLAAETLLKVCLAALDPQKTPAQAFPELIRQVRTALAKDVMGDVPRAAAIQHVHDIRNAAQHKGRLPAIEEEREARSNVRGFIDELLAMIWGLSLDLVRFAGLVANAGARERLNEAEDAIAEDDSETAVVKASEAVQWAIIRVHDALVGRDDPFARGIVALNTFGEPEASSELTQSFKRTQETVVYLALGLDYGHYMRFKAIAGDVTFTMDGRAHPYGQKADLTQADAEYAVSFATEALLQIEARVGDIEKPFGREHWAY